MRALITALPVQLKADKNELEYRRYVCDSFHLQGENKYITTRYDDIIEVKPKDTRKPVDVARDIIEKAGLTVQ